jgi:hypothetical protein
MVAVYQAHLVIYLCLLVRFNPPVINYHKQYDSVAAADKVVKAMSQHSLRPLGRPKDNQEARSALPEPIRQGQTGPNKQRPAGGQVTYAAKTTYSASAASHTGVA